MNYRSPDIPPSDRRTPGWSTAAPPRNTNRIVQQCQAGLIDILQRDGVLSFAAPATLRTGDIEEPYLTQVLSALGVDRQDVIAHQWVDNGPGWAVVQLGTAREVLALEPEFRDIPTAMIGVIGAQPEGSTHAYELRAFAPGIGVPEDPVYGSMNASVGQWLTRTGKVTGGYRVSQGSQLGRAGDITITADADGTVWVGGTTTTCLTGTALI